MTPFTFIHLIGGISKTGEVLNSIEKWNGKEFVLLNQTLQYPESDFCLDKINSTHAIVSGNQG